MDKVYVVVQVYECLQIIHRQRVIPLLVMPFFFVLLLYRGQRGLLVVIEPIQKC